MAHQEWTVKRTRRFRGDLGLYAVSEERAAHWEQNIVDNPLIGTVWEESGDTSLRRYEVGEFWVVYAFSWERETIWLAQIRKKSDDPKDTKKLTGTLKTIWERFVQFTVVGR